MTRIGSQPVSLQFPRKKSLMKIGKLARRRAPGLEGLCAEGGVLMRAPIHVKRYDDGYFHAHPLHTMFALIAAFVLAALVVLVLVPSAG